MVRDSNLFAGKPDQSDRCCPLFAPRDRDGLCSECRDKKLLKRIEILEHNVNALTEQLNPRGMPQYGA